jgi:hypothetical protein
MTAEEFVSRFAKTLLSQQRANEPTAEFFARTMLKDDDSKLTLRELMALQEAWFATEYGNAVHEAGHVIVAAALGWKFSEKTAVAIGWSRRDPAIAVGSSRRRGRGRVNISQQNDSVLEQIAFDLAGGISQYRVAPPFPPDAPFLRVLLQAGIDGDVENIMNTIDYKRHAADIIFAIAKAVCQFESTDEVIEFLSWPGFPPDFGPRRIKTPHFKIITKAANLARDILSRNWVTVLALARTLMQSKRMSGEELTAFLKARGVS